MSVYKRGATWTAHVHWTAGGKPRQAKKSGFKYKKDAEAAEAELLGRARSGRYVPVGRLSTGEYLTGWLDGLPVSGRHATTIKAYRSLARNHVLAQVGEIPLVDLSSIDVDGVYTAMVGRGLKLRTVRHCHSMLRRALQDAVDKGLIPSNPAATASPPSTSSTRAPEAAVWSPEQLGTFLAATDGHYLGALIRVAAMTGLRRGELCGLRWEDVDLDGATLTVRRTVAVLEGGGTEVTEPKTATSRRTIDLDPVTVARLRRHRVAQLELRMLCGPGWVESGHVFTGPSGDYLHPNWVSATEQRLIDRSGLPRITPHGFRHSHITHMLAATGDHKTTSARAGHSSAAFTLDRYGHVLPGRQAAAAAAVAALVDNA